MRSAFATPVGGARLLALLAAAGLLGSSPAFARSQGISSISGPMVDGPATCSGALCHGAARDDLVAVSITGPTTLAPGERAVYSIAMTEVGPNGLQLGTGINVSLFFDGERLPLDPSLEQEPDFPQALQILDGEITHGLFVNQLGPPDGGVGVFAWDFPVVAPDAEGTLVLMGALNSFNGNFVNDAGDHWSRDEWEVQVVPEPEGGATALATLAAAASVASRRARRGPRRRQRLRAAGV